MFALEVFCVQCGGRFAAESQRTLTCGAECFNARVAALRKMTRERDRERRMADLLVGTCVVCGCEFERRCFRAKVCGTKCRDRHKKNRQRAIYHERRDELVARGLVKPRGEMTNCVECGVEFERLSSTHATCSWFCRKARRTRQSRDHARRMSEERREALIAAGIKKQRPGNQNARKYKDDAERREAEKVRRREKERERRRRDRLERMQPEPPAKWEAIPCEACEHWKPMQGADLGGYCSVSRWLVCKPFAPGAKPYAPVRGRILHG